MAKVPKEELEEFQKVMMRVDELIIHTDEVLEQASIEAPSHSEFLRNPEATYKWIMDTQQIYTRVANAMSRLKVEDRRIWELGERLKDDFGVVETEDLRKQVNRKLKGLRDTAAMLKESKFDLKEIISSVRSIQSAVTNRYRAAGGN